MGRRVKRIFIAGICLILCMGFSAAVQAEYLFEPADQAKAEALQWLKSICGQKVGDTDGSEGLIEAYYDFLWEEADSHDSVRDYLTNELPEGWVRLKGAVPQPGDILLYCPEKYDHIFKDKIAVCGEGNMHYIQMQKESGSACSVMAVAERYDSDDLMYPPYWGLIRPDFSRAIPLEDEGIMSLSIGGTKIVDYMVCYRTDNLPQGAAYDRETNTLTLTGCSLSWIDDIITYSGTKDLHIQVNGANTFTAAGDFLSYEREWDEPEGGEVYIEGTGSITFTSQDPQVCNALIWQHTQVESVNERDGDIHIDGVTLISNADGIISNFSNVYVKNAKITVNGYKSREADYGITAGRVTTVHTPGENGSWVTGPTTAFGGLLSIENSEIEIRNCITELACTTYQISGGNYYGGEDSAQYSIDAASLFNRVVPYMSAGVSRQMAEHGYLRITSQNLGLSKGYRIVVDTSSTDSEHGKAEVSKKTAAAGSEIHVTVTPDSGYVLDQLFVNGEPISGSSFTMPEKDVKVKATFKKKKVKVSSIKLTGTTKQVAKGKKITLTANVSPADATNKTLTWSTSNKKYATVNSKGVVTTKAAGAGKTVTITVKAKDGSGKKATYKIRIMKGMVKKVTIKGKTSVKAGKTLKLKASVKATSGANKTLTWSSSNKKYATVNKNGVVKALRAGKGKTVKITAKATDGSGRKATIKIKIK